MKVIVLDERHSSRRARASFKSPLHNEIQTPIIVHVHPRNSFYVSQPFQRFRSVQSVTESATSVPDFCRRTTRSIARTRLEYVGGLAIAGNGRDKDEIGIAIDVVITDRGRCWESAAKGGRLGHE